MAWSRAFAASTHKVVIAAKRTEEHGQKHPREGRQRRASPGPLVEAIEQHSGAWPGSDAIEEAAKVLGHHAGRGIPFRGFFFEGLEDDRLEVARQARTEPARGDRLSNLSAWTTSSGSLGPERRAAGQKLIKDRAQCVNVCRAADGAPVACSGAMYSGVPSVWPVEVSPLLRSSASASPKSAILGTSPLSGPASPVSAESLSRMFEGLRSRWTTPHWCAASIAAARVATSSAAARRRPAFADDPVGERAAVAPFEGQVGSPLVDSDLVDLHDLRVLHPGRQARPRDETAAFEPPRRIRLPGSS